MQNCWGTVLDSANNDWGLCLGHVTSSIDNHVHASA